jgi:nucleotide-binding universal stress UspA family protein
MGCWPEGGGVVTRGLVVVEAVSRDEALLERARQFAEGSNGDLVVVALATPDEYEELEATLEMIGEAEGTSYDEAAVWEGLSGDVDDLAEDVLGGRVRYDRRTVVRAPDEHADALLAIADRRGCDHILLPGRRRSPTGKAVFGDRTQQVLLRFEGHVTAALHDS